jgi:Cof subfamily protein (haloacid dehalogenase superfamily)
MTIKLIVTDLDRTLLRTDKTVSDYTRGIFARCRDCGILTAFATARYFRTVEEWLLPLTGMSPDVIISLNGAYAYTYPARKTLYSAMLDADTGDALARRLRGNGITVGTDTARYSAREINPTHAAFTVVCDFAEPLNQRVHYIDVHADRETIAEITAKFPNVRFQGYSDVDLLSITHKDARKHTALAAVMGTLGFAPEEVAVFGDDVNDIDMLTLPGVNAVAVENAIPEVKAVAGYICSCNDADGVAKWIEENVL